MYDEPESIGEESVVPVEIECARERTTVDDGQRRRRCDPCSGRSSGVEMVTTVCALAINHCKKSLRHQRECLEMLMASGDRWSVLLF